MSYNLHGGDESIVSGRDTNITIHVDGQPLTQPLTSPVSVTSRIRYGLPPIPARVEGRADEMAFLRQRLLTSEARERGVTPLAVYGMGGLGKTTLAAWFAYQHLEDFSAIWWVEAEHPHAIPDQYLQFARALGYTVADAAEAEEVVRDHLSQRESWLVVFDNVESRHEVERFFPTSTSGSGALVITTRNALAWGTDALALTVLDPDTVTQWLLDATHSANHAAASELADLLDGLPLAVSQAIGYCTSNGTPLERYLHFFKTRNARVLASDTGVIAEHGTVDTTFRLSIDVIRQDPLGASATALIEMMAYLAPERIPLSLFTLESLEASDEFDVDEAVGMLRRYSLISRDGNMLYIHRLVQAITRHTSQL